MKKDDKNSSDKFSELRKRAEILINQKDIDSKTLSIEEIQKLIHELGTYQIELELQNEDLRLSQEELELSRRKYFDLYEFAPVGYLTVSSKGIILNANLTASDMLGAERLNLIKQPLSAFISNEDQGSYYLFRKNLLTSMRSQTCEFRINKYDGSSFYVQMKCDIRPELDGDEGQFRAIITDITERVKIENKLKKSEEKHRIIVDNLNVGISIISPKMEVLELNARMKKWFPNVDTGKRPLCYKAFNSPPGDEICSYCPTIRTLKDGTVSESITTTPSEDKIINYRIVSSPITDYKGKIVAAVEMVEDITELIKFEKEKKNQDILRSIGTLAGGIAHDFNNILTGVFGNIALARIKLSKDHPSSKFLNDAEKSMIRATELTGKLLTFSKGGGPIKKDEKIDEIINEVVTFDLSGSNIKYIYKNEANLLHANVDKVQIQQVFSNLTINARQAMPKGGCLHITINNEYIFDGNNKGLKKGQYIKIIVEDEGIGINKKDLNHIFDPYFSTKETGRGLGLATTFSIIKKHNGSITVNSIPGKGTAFTIFLSAKVSDKNISNENNTEKSNLKEICLPNDLKILVIDDDKAVCRLFEDTFSFLGISAKIINSGNEAVEIYMKSVNPDKLYDIVIIDLTIRGEEGGIESAKKILNIYPDAKIIALSGYSDSPGITDFHKYGFVGSLAKPFTLENIQSVINRVLS